MKIFYNIKLIAFFISVLIFFSNCYTHKNVDSGITRMLPPPTASDTNNIKSRNILIVLLTEDDELFVNSKKRNLDELENIVKEFYDNPNNAQNLSEGEIVEIDLLGKQEVSKGVISLHNNRGVSYSFYIQVQNIIVEAINELRNEFAKQFFNNEFDKLNEEQQKAIKKKYPFSISEAEPE